MAHILVKGSTMARSTAGLTEPDIAELRRQLADGKRPRVQLSGPHFPAGAAGTVVRIGSPDTDGADYLRVRVKVNGMLDELAFAPGELSLRRPGRAAKAAAARPAKASGTTKASRTAKASGTPGAPGTTKASGTARGAGAVKAARPASADRAASAARPAKAPAQPPLEVATVEPAEPAVPQRSVTGRKATAPKGRRASAPKVSFTISSSGASWALSGTRGNKNLVRNVALPPGVVTAAAELFGQPALAEAVSEINDAALAEARARADQLRAELEQLEEVLATHRRP